MKFTIVSHACMKIENNSGSDSLLFDPWFVGTCYWRSWWNYPEPTTELIESLKPTAIYISHLHWDHFHGPSLRRFSPDIRIYVPKVLTRRMVVDLHNMGYRNVVEIPHAGSVELWPGTRLHSYQFGPIATDSAAVIHDGRTTIVNLNDCKLFGMPLAQLTSRFPKIDFCMRSHSSADSVPYCIEGYKSRFPELRNKKAYIEAFTNCALSIGAKYAIPFASNHCFLHRETVEFNDTIVNPMMVSEHYNQLAAELKHESRCVVMPPGSTWHDESGFKIVKFDYSRQNEYLELMRIKYKDKIQKQYQKEDRAKANFDHFKRYFSRLLEAVPSLVRRRLPRVIFVVEETAGTRLFLLDPPRRVVAEIAEPISVDFKIKVHPLILNDCTRKKMFSSWSAGKRLRFVLPPSETSPAKIITLFSLIDFYESDGLPLWKNFSLRQVGIRLRRWREVAEAARLVVRHKFMRRPFVVSDLYPVRQNASFKT